MKRKIAYKLARLTYKFNIPFAKVIRTWQMKLEMNSQNKVQIFWWHKPVYAVAMRGINYKFTRKSSNWLAHRVPLAIRYQIA